MLPLHPKSFFRFLSINFLITSSLTRKKGEITPLHPNALILFLENDVIPLEYCDVMNAPNALDACAYVCEAPFRYYSSPLKMVPFSFTYCLLVPLSYTFPF